MLKVDVKGRRRQGGYGKKAIAPIAAETILDNTYMHGQ